MSQSNAVSSSLPGNLACLLMLQHQINFCSFSLAFSPFSSDLHSEIISYRCFAMVEMMEKDYSRIPRKKSKWRSPKLPCAAGSALTLRGGWRGLWPLGSPSCGCQLSLPVPARPPELLSQLLPSCHGWESSPWPPATPQQLLSICPCATGRVGSWGSSAGTPRAPAPFSSCQQSRETSQRTLFAMENTTGRAGSAPGASLHTDSCYRQQ